MVAEIDPNDLQNLREVADDMGLSVRELASLVIRPWVHGE